MKTEVYLAGATRTPIGAFNGVFSNVPATKLAAEAVKSAVSRSGAAKEAIDEVIMGCVLSAGLGQNIARQAAIGAGLPVSCGATTVNKMCGSAMRAVRMAAQAVQCEDAGVIVAGGTENMTRAPYLLLKGRSGYRMGHDQVIDSLIYDGLADAYDQKHMGEHAEMCATKFGLTREQQDAFAVASYKRAIAATEAGHCKHEICPIEIADKKATKVIAIDEEPTKFNEEKLRSLRPAFRSDGTITAGNASSISDGAAAIVVASGDRIKSLGLRPQARVLGYASVAVEPAWFTIAPIQAIRMVLDRCSLRIADVDLFEINEAFSAVVLASMKEHELPHDKVNVLGGAVAIGHPIGASGARILVTLINALKVRNKRVGIATACIGGGEAGAIAIERCD